MKVQAVIRDGSNAQRVTSESLNGIQIKINKPGPEDFGDIPGAGISDTIDLDANGKNASALGILEDGRELSIEAGGNATGAGIAITRGQVALAFVKRHASTMRITSAQLLLKIENNVWFQQARGFQIASQIPATEFIYRWQPLGSEIRNVTRFNHPGTSDEYYGFYQCLADEHRHLFGGAAGSLPQPWKPAIMQRDIAPLIYIRPMILAFFGILGYKVESQLLDSYYGRGLGLAFNPRLATYNQEYQEEISMLASGTVAENITGPDGKVYRALKPDSLTRTGNYVQSTDKIAFRATKDCIHRMEVTATDVNDKIVVCQIVYRNAAGQYFSTADKEEPVTNTPAHINMTDCLTADGGQLIDAWWQTSQRLYQHGFASTQVWFSFLIPVNNDGTSKLGALKSFRIQVWPDFWPEYEVRVKPRFLLPKDWTMDKLLKGLTHAFGLEWDTDNDRKVVRVDPKFGGTINWWNGGPQSLTIPSFFDETPLDLTDDQPLSDSTVEFNREKIDRKQFIVGYRSRQETWKTYNLSREVPTQAVKLSPDASLKVEEKYNEFFAGCIHAKYPFPSDLSDDLQIQMPLFYKESYPAFTAWKYEDRRNKSDFEPVLLFHAGQRGGRDGEVYMPFGIPSNDYDRPFSGTGTLWAAQPLPAAFAINYNDPTGDDPMLSYSDVTLDSGVKVRGLFWRFMLRRYAQIANGGTWSCSFWWPLGKWLTFGKVGKIRHKGRNIIVKQTSYQPSGNKVTITGEFDEYPTAEDVGNIIHG